MIGRYFNRPETPTVKTIPIPVGNAFHISWGGANIVLDENVAEQALFLYYTVDNVKVRVNDWENYFCSTFASLYIWGSGISEMFGLTQLPYLPIYFAFPVISVYTNVLAHLRYSLSTCSWKSIYGHHKTTLIREFFNASTNSVILLEVKNPKEYIVVPATPYSKLNESSSCQDANRLSTNDVIVFFLRVTLECVVLIWVCRFIMRTGYYVYKLYRKKVFSPLQNYILKRKIHCQLKRKTYDVAILCCEEDHEMWMDGILDSLENTFHATVFFVSRDFEHLGGNSECDLYLRMYQETECFILHVTKSFLDNNTFSSYNLNFYWSTLKKNKQALEKL